MYTDRYTMPPQLAEAFERARVERNVSTGQAANRKGKLAEDRVLSAAFVVCEKEEWLYVARPATMMEDHDGIDIIVYSSIGKLFLQVKSSHCGARQFRYKRPDAKVIVIIVDPDMGDDKIENKVRDALGRLRKYFMKNRRKH